MKFRSMILVLTIAFSVIFMSMIGTSYAYYISTDGTTIDITTSNIDTGVAVVFEQSQYININTGVPISDSDVDTFASASIFKLNPDNKVLSGADVAVNISIIDISIDNALKIEDFKYRLSCSGGSSTKTFNGTGEDFTDEVVNSGILKLGTISTADGSFNVSNTNTCTLRIWLNETGENQNDLMNKKFRGLIKVNTLFRK